MLAPLPAPLVLNRFLLPVARLRLGWYLGLDDKGTAVIANGPHRAPLCTIALQPRTMRLAIAGATRWLDARPGYPSAVVHAIASAREQLSVYLQDYEDCSRLAAEAAACIAGEAEDNGRWAEAMARALGLCPTCGDNLRAGHACAAEAA